jgi:anti-sigma regulatory factor (Ser/Thr protein kinase)
VANPEQPAIASVSTLLPPALYQYIFLRHGIPCRGYVSAMSQARLVLTPDILAPSKARELLAEVVDDRSGSERLTRAQVALSEVVNNAVRHGAVEGSDPIELEIERVEDIVRVRVMQSLPVPERPSIVNLPKAWSTGGYGLVIIDSVADRWGVQLQPPAVWFEVQL